MRNAGRLLVFAFVVATRVHAEDPVTEARPQAVTVSVDFAALSPQTSARIDALSLEARVVLRLIEEGFAVSAPSAEPEVRVTLVESEGAVTLTAEGGGGAEMGRVGLLTGTAKELQLEIAQKIVELARGRVAAVQRAREAQRRPPPPSPLRRPPPPDVAPPEPADPLTVDVSLGAGVLWRGYGVDPQLTLAAGLMTVKNVGFGLWLGYDRPAGEDLDLHEFQVTAGPRLGLLRSAHWDIDLGAAVGVHAHSFHYTGTAPNLRDATTVGFVGLVPMTLRYKAGGTWRIGVNLTPGYGPALVHRADGEVFFQRGAARLEAALAAGATF